MRSLPTANCRALWRRTATSNRQQPCTSLPSRSRTAPMPRIDRPFRLWNAGHGQSLRNPIRRPDGGAQESRAHPMSSSFRSVAGQDGGGELAGGIISGGSGVETGGVTMMPAGGDGAVSAAGGACGSVSAQRRSAEKRQPSATAPTTVISLFIQPISLRPVPLYSDPADAARELPCRVARPTQKICFAWHLFMAGEKKTCGQLLKPKPITTTCFAEIGCKS